MGKIRNILLFVVVFMLIVLTSWNVLLHRKIRKMEPIVDIQFKTDTFEFRDTLYEKIGGIDTIYLPSPVNVDTAKGIAEYRDTTWTDIGWIISNEIVRGQILSKKIEFEFSVPEYYKTRIITNTTIKTVRNNLLFVDVGFGYDFERIYPNVGITYVWNKHNRIARLSYSYDKRLDFSIGFNIFK